MGSRVNKKAMDWNWSSHMSDDVAGRLSAVMKIVAITESRSVVEKPMRSPLSNGIQNLAEKFLVEAKFPVQVTSQQPIRLYFMMR